MHRFRTILVAADFSENSAHAFRVAGAVAVEEKTRLIVLHVVAPDRVAAERASPGQAAAEPSGASGAEDQLQILKRRMRAVYSPSGPIDVQYRLTERDDAASEILRVADAIGADLIVMGTHGRTGLRRLVAGSVASTVLAKAHCSVLALRSGQGEHKADAMRVILHPTDFSKDSAAALRVARSLARDHGARLIVLHVVPLDAFLDGNLEAELDTRDYQDSLDAMRIRLGGPDPRYPVETRLVRGFEAEEILREARDFACDLIVMGTHGRTGLARLLMGNTAESVLPKAECPVLVVKSSRGTPAPTSDRGVSGAETAS
jgi:nucleotide-binding universal stress UspA family protein